MALKQDCENIADRASRIIQIIQFAQQAAARYNDNPDLDIPLSPAIRQALQAKVADLQRDIKTIVVAW